MWLSGSITVGRKAVSIMNTIKSDSITTLTDRDNNMSRSKSQKPLTESMTMFHLEEDKENVIRRESLSLELFSPVRGPDTSYTDSYGQEEDVRMSLDGYLSPSREQQSDMTNLDLSKMTPLTSTRISEDDDLMTSSPENIDCNCISVELLSLPEKISFYGPDDIPVRISED